MHPQAKSALVTAESVIAVLTRIVKENGARYVWSYLFAVVCLLIVAASTGYTAWIMKAIINEAFANRRADLLVYICGSIFVAFVVRGFANYWQAVALSKIGNNIVATYQQRLFSHLMALGVEYYADQRSARVSGKISQNVSGIRDVLNITVTSIARDLLGFLALIVVMVVQDWVLTIFVFLLAPPLLLGIRYVSKRLRQATREAVEINSHVFGALQETIQGITIVKAFTMENELCAKVNHIIHQAEKRSNRIARLSERTSPMTDAFAGFVVAGVFGYAAYRSIHDHVPPGAFFSFVTALLMAYDPARRLSRVQISLERAVVNARMIYEILDSNPSQPEQPFAKDLQITSASVQFEDLSFSYSNSGVVLNKLSLIAEGGKTTALVGPSGAGKSTVISLVPRFYDPSGGRILIDGQDIACVTRNSLRRALAYVSQQSYLFEGSILDNIRYGRPDATDLEVEDAAKLAYAHDFILKQPQGYHTSVGENGVTLSGGQRQRLSIARALVRQAPILLLDEATSSLDSESEREVQKALENAMSGRTVIVIAHRLSTIVNADKIVVVVAGCAVEEGVHLSLSAKESGVYARLYNLHGKTASIPDPAISQTF